MTPYLGSYKKCRMIENFLIYIVSLFIFMREFSMRLSNYFLLFGLLFFTSTELLETNPEEEKLFQSKILSPDIMLQKIKSFDPTQTTDLDSALRELHAAAEYTNVCTIEYECLFKNPSIQQVARHLQKEIVLLSDLYENRFIRLLISQKEQAQTPIIPISGAFDKFEEAVKKAIPSISVEDVHKNTLIYLAQSYMISKANSLLMKLSGPDGSTFLLDLMCVKTRQSGDLLLQELKTRDIQHSPFLDTVTAETLQAYTLVYPEIQASLGSIFAVFYNYTSFSVLLHSIVSLELRAELGLQRLDNEDDTLRLLEKGKMFALTELTKKLQEEVTLAARLRAELEEALRLKDKAFETLQKGSDGLRDVNTQTMGRVRVLTEDLKTAKQELEATRKLFQEEGEKLVKANQDFLVTQEELEKFKAE